MKTPTVFEKLEMVLEEDSRRSRALGRLPWLERNAIEPEPVPVRRPKRRSRTTRRRASRRS